MRGEKMQGRPIGDDWRRFLATRSELRRDPVKTSYAVMPGLTLA
jgi:hypothetical protein